MKSLKQIRNEFDVIVASSGLTGEVLGVTSNLLSKAVYDNNLTFINYTTESHPSICKFTSSAITHALDKCYCVHRGTNQRFKITNIISTTTRSVKKYDVATEVNGFKLVYAHDYNFISSDVIDKSSVKIPEIELILCRDVISGSHTISTADNSKFKFDILSSDISDHFTLYDSAGIEITHLYRSIPDLTSVATEETQYLQLTLPGYAIRLINDAQFIPGEVYNYKYLPYLDEELSASSINAIPGFITSSLGTLSVTSYSRLDRESDPSKIYYNSNREFLSGKVMKSDYDITETINSYFEGYFKSSKIYVSIANNIGGVLDNSITILFIPTASDNEILERILTFYRQLVPAYYITQEVKFINISSPNLGTGNTLTYSFVNNEVVTASIDRNNYVSFKLDMVVYYEKSIPDSGIKELLNEYTKNIGGSINYFKFLADLSEVDNVKYAEVVATNNMPSDSPLKSYSWNVGEPLNLYLGSTDLSSTAINLRFYKDGDTTGEVSGNETDVLSGVNIIYKLYSK